MFVTYGKFRQWGLSQELPSMNVRKFHPHLSLGITWPSKLTLSIYRHMVSDLVVVIGCHEAMAAHHVSKWSDVGRVGEWAELHLPTLPLLHLHHKVIVQSFQHHFTYVTWTPIYILASLKVSFPQVIPLKLCKHFWIAPYLLHVLPISVISI